MSCLIDNNINNLFVVANVDIVKALKMPTTYEEVKNYVTHMDDRSGIAGWNNDKTLSQVN